MRPAADPPGGLPADPKLMSDPAEPRRWGLLVAPAGGEADHPTDSGRCDLVRSSPGGPPAWWPTAAAARAWADRQQGAPPEPGAPAVHLYLLDLDGVALPDPDPAAVVWEDPRDR